MSKQKTYGASVTVEAVFLIPVLLFVILAFMYMALYFYDQVYIETSGQRAIFEQEQKIRYSIDEKTGMILYENVSVKGLENLWQDFEKNKLDILKKLKQQQKYIYLGKVENREITAEKEKLEMKERTQISRLTKGIGTYFPKANRSQSHSIKMYVHNPAEFVRGYTVLEDVAEGLGQGEKIKETLSKLLKYMGR